MQTHTEAQQHHEDEDEAAKAVRSILGHNDLEAVAVAHQQSDKLRIAHQGQQPQRQITPEEANNNKDATEIKRTSTRLSTAQPPNRGLKRPHNSVEIQYVTTSASESKLDAPGKS